ncbi:META domain-containing protein [Herpetosiphon gulosus]|uniref:DUF306 domain-containing protein n=1 Tax=Herpetosiphon gulosus TaxID=1973496 RepID=A0ABP9XAH9_9CHLR
MRSIISILLITIVLAGCGSTPAATIQPTNAPTIVDEAALIGSRWNVLTINGKPLVGSKPLPFVIESASQVSGDGGCNGYGGGITIDGTTIRIGPLVSTLMACAEPGIQDQETALHQQFEQVRIYQHTETHLTLLDAEGSVIITMVRQPVP